MPGLRTSSPRRFAARQVAICIPIVLLVNGCGRDMSANQLAGTSSAAANSSATQPGIASSSGVQINVSPALTPSFDPTIHDYVISCASSPEVQFTAFLRGSNFGLFGPGDRVSKPLPYPLETFQKSLTLNPGQRFQFAMNQAGQEASIYSVRCLPSDFPPLTVSGGNRAPQAEWYLFAPTLSFVPTVNTSAPYIIIVDSNGTPI